MSGDVRHSDVRMPWVVGLTGGIASGKSTVARKFAALGATLIDVDEVAHRLTSKGGAALPALRAVLAEKFFTATGELERAHLREAIFSDPALRRQVEGIVHPLIFSEIVRMLHAIPPNTVVILEVPLLVETKKLLPLCQRVVVVDCPESLQRDRVKERDGVGEQQIDSILAAQATRQARLAIADDVVNNHATMASIAPQIEKLYAQYQRLAHRGERKNLL